MKYTWFNVGEQDRLIHKVCMLGPWRLDIKESRWEGDKLYVKCCAYMWSDKDEQYYPVKMPKDNFIRAGYECKKAEKYMEDWYGEHIIMPKLLMGTEDGQTIRPLSLKDE